MSKSELTPNGGEISTYTPRLARVSQIVVPEIVPEKYDISGFVFSKRFLKAANLTSLRIPRTDTEWQALMQYKDLTKQIKADSDGGPTVNENWIQIWIDGSNPNAGSEANYIWMYFGRNRKIKLWGVDHTRFPKGWWLKWDLNDVSDYLETIPTDAWDEIHLVTDSGDGILINRVKIVHSSVTILDWTCNSWLDASKHEQHNKLGFAAKILSNKLGQIGNRWIPQIHWAARELGKSDGSKYGTHGAWCSEFASWCLRKALWDTPTGSIGSSDMESYFNSIGRKKTKEQVLNKEYKLKEGDYIRLPNHSILFIRYLNSSDANNPTAGSRLVTIEGNTSQTVKVRNNKTIAQILSIGNTH